MPECSRCGAHIYGVQYAPAVCGMMPDDCRHCDYEAYAAKHTGRRLLTPEGGDGGPI